MIVKGKLDNGKDVQGELHWELTSYGKLYIYVGNENSPLVVYEDCTKDDIEDAMATWVFEDFGLLIWDGKDWVEGL